MKDIFDMNDKQQDARNVRPPAVRREPPKAQAETEEKPYSLGIVLAGEAIYGAGWLAAPLAGGFGHPILGFEAMIGCGFLSFIVGFAGLLMGIAEIRVSQGRYAVFAAVALCLLNAGINYTIGGH